LVVPILSEIYPNCRKLFQKSLRLKQADLGTIIDESSTKPRAWSLELNKKTLFALDALLADFKVECGC
jgi:hypothetical protein